MVNLIDYKKLEKILIQHVKDICKVDDYGKYQELVSYNNYYIARLYILKQTELELKKIGKGGDKDE